MLRAQINCRGLFVKYVLAEQDRMDTAAIDRLNYPNLTIVHEAAVPFAMRVQNSTMPLLSYLHQVCFTSIKLGEMLMYIRVHRNVGRSSDQHTRQRSSDS